MDESVKSCQKSSDPIIRQATHRFDQGSSAAQVPWIRWSFSFVGVGSTTTIGPEIKNEIIWKDM